ncbi:MAG TPA: DUF3048 domain-containing protein [Acidimicrobiales bacterium]|nr:DUF3048 domain-containing protein [Acidimicrobiales bacterium]
MPDEPDPHVPGHGAAREGLDGDDVTGMVPATGATASPDGEGPEDRGGDDTRAMTIAEMDAVMGDTGPTAMVAATPAPDPTSVTRSLPAAGPEAEGAAHAAHRARRSRTVTANRAWLAGVVGAAVLLAGAGIALAVTGKKGPSSGNGRHTAATEIPAVTTPSGPPCPLTGAPSSSPQVPQRPALAVKVDNYPQARPQSGLNQADIVYEEPVEGGITRLVAVFQCQSPSLIGPIRSARAVDLQILDGLSDPVFVHAGGIAPVLSLIDTGNLIDDNVFEYGSIVQTPPGRVAPYDTYIAAAAGWGLNRGDTTPPKPVFSYSTTPLPGTAVATVHVPFSGTNNTLWTWSAAHKQWMLSYSGTPATVLGGGQIGTTNIVVEKVQVSYGPWLENDVGGYEVQSRLTGSGPLEVFRNGTGIAGTWHRAALSSPTTLTSSTGAPITLQPGPTWVEIVPSAIPVTTAPTPISTTGSPTSGTGGTGGTGGT